MQLFTSIWQHILHITFNHNVHVAEITGMLKRASEGPPNYFRTSDGCTPNRRTLINDEHLLACIVFKLRCGSVAAPSCQTERVVKLYHPPGSAHTMINPGSTTHVCRCFSESRFCVDALKLAPLLHIHLIGG
jgi:hypothetical protein